MYQCQSGTMVHKRKIRNASGREKGGKHGVYLYSRITGDIRDDHLAQNTKPYPGRITASKVNIT